MFFLNFGEKKMKKLILFYIFFTILFFGCDNSSSDANSNYSPLNDSEGAALSLAADTIVFDIEARGN